MTRQPTSAVVDAVFHMHEITKIYRVGEVTVHALRGVTLDLLPGEFVVILGPSGSGKSTLLNILGGLDVPTSGEVHYREHNLTAATREELTRFRREHVGFVFQFYNLIPSLQPSKTPFFRQGLGSLPVSVLAEFYGRPNHPPTGPGPRFDQRFERQPSDPPLPLPSQPATL